MFGYILPEKPELKIKEYEMFRAYYCGLCKSIGNRYGQAARGLLNYDSAFLALLLSSLNDESLDVKKERCIVHPHKKSRVIKNNDIIDYAADINILLAYLKLKDNYKDDRSVLSAAGIIILKRCYKKIEADYKEKCGIITQKLDALSRLENEKCGSIDMVAEPFALIMSEIVAHTPFSLSGNSFKALSWFGYNLGKWIYIIDAYDDLVKDIKGKKYNPFIYGYNYKGEDSILFKQRIKCDVEFMLTTSLSQMAMAYDLLNIKINQGIVENIIYMGMLRKTEQILGVGSCEKVEKSI